MTSDSPEHQALIRAAQAGDSQAFEKLLQLHYDRLYRFACKWCGNATDAEDIAQQACIKLARSLQQYRFEAAFSTWLYRLVVSCAIDWRRSEDRHQQTALGPPQPEMEASTSDSPESGIYLQQVLKRLESWGQGFKTTALLVLAEGLSHAEAAQVMEIKESTVSWRLHEIRKKLKHYEPREGGDHE